jgi:hypothetical protein
MVTTNTDTPERSLHAERTTPVPERSLSLSQLLGCWLLLAVVMSANGIFRELVLVPIVGHTRAGVLSAALGIALILTVTRVAYRSPRTHAQMPSIAVPPLGVSLAWVGMTVAFEELFGHYVDGKSWAELAANYALWRGQLWPLVLLTVGLAPVLWGRWRMPRPRAASPATYLKGGPGW